MKKYLFLILLVLLTSSAHADTKISDLTADTSPTTDDLLITVNDPAGAKVNRKVTIGNLFKAANMTVDGTNVGIGSTVPRGILDLGAGAIYGDGSHLTGTSSISGLTTNFLPKASSATAIANSQMSDDGANVGINTTAPGGKFEVKTSVNTYPMKLTDGTRTVGIFTGTNTVVAAYPGATIGTFTNDPVLFGANMCLSSAGCVIATPGGNVGIGTWLPRGILDVGIGSKFSVLTGGNVGVGSITPGAKLDVQGALRAFTATSPITKKTGANTACNTTCAGTMCVWAQESTSKDDLDCADATADVCGCLGP